MKQMRKYKNFRLRNTAFRVLFEQDEGGGAEDDLFGGGEGGDEGGGDEAAGGEDAAGGEEAGAEGGEEKKEDEKEEEPKIKISAEDRAKLGDSIDDELEGLMVDYETDARKSAQLATERMSANESFRRAYKRMLFEVAADDIDLKHFAGNVARLVKNYDNLIDMESIILNKAYSHIQNNYGEDTVKALKDVLEQEFDIEVERPEVEKDEPEVPIAVGGASASGGAGA